jgi:sulfur-oxidizing protein SoxB
MTLLKSGEKIDPSKTYIVSGWASVNEDTEGPQIWDVVENYIRRQETISVEPNSNVEVVGI